VRIGVISRATAINNFVDIGPTAPSTGDLYVFSDDVFFTSDPAAKVGRADGRCTLIDPSSARFGCTIITSLPKGDITTEGILVNASGAKSTGAVTGGVRGTSETPAAKRFSTSDRPKGLTKSRSS